MNKKLTSRLSPKLEEPAANGVSLEHNRDSGNGMRSGAGGVMIYKN